MKVIDPGHWYTLHTLDGQAEPSHQLRFVKRMGEKYPGNTTTYPGTMCQEVLRVLIDRVQYVNNQIPDEHNAETLKYLRYALWMFEDRAAERHGRSLEAGVEGIENVPFCTVCGHIECDDDSHVEEKTQ